jgi:hypothetical protein
MTFKNLAFRSHPNLGNKGIQAVIKMGNGKILSVVAGDYLYCNTKFGNQKGAVDLKESDVLTFETAIISEDNGVGDVRGWQSRKDINKIIKENNGRKN